MKRGKKENHVLKLIVAGDGGVGKTCFMNRYCNDIFDSNSALTKGIDFFCNTIKNNDAEYVLSLFDFGGQEQFRFMLSDFVKGARGAFYLFDLTRLSTLDKMNEWFEIIESNSEIPVLLLGTKRDLVDDETLKSIEEHVLSLINQYYSCIDYMEISSKTGENITEAVELLISKIAHIKLNFL